ncbi:centromere protein P-like [Lineus longissimus]|uniref:centromere protein P-like n=1 Tax=Lineus longissimus TaxID=88925 RepID=UPI00315D49A9
MAANSSHHESFSELHELSRAVSKTIHEFSFDDGHINGFDKGFNVSSNYKAEKSNLEKQLQDIEKEVTSLEHELECQRATGTLDTEDVNKLRSLLGKDPEDEDYYGPHKEEIGGITKKLDLLAKVTGISFTGCRCSLTKFESRNTERKYIIDGNTYGLNFQLEFNVIERQVAETLTNAYITALTIAVDEVVIDELESLICRCEDNNAVNQFLRTFSNFANWFSQRQKAFLHFKDKYPDRVDLTQGQYGSVMQFSDPENRGVIWTVSWNMLITVTGDVTPDIELFVKAPAQMIDMDDDAVLRQTPEKFCSLLQHFGIEQAIDTIIRITSS